MNCLTFECMDFFVRNNVPETIYPMPLSSAYMYLYKVLLDKRLTGGILLHIKTIFSSHPFDLETLDL